MISHVLPFPGNAGQQQRVLYTLKAARDRFHVTFLAPVAAAEMAVVAQKMSALCDEVLLLPSRHSSRFLLRIWHRIAGAVYALATGLKTSNYIIGRRELAPRRIEPVLARGDFDCVLLEYWHAAAACRVLQENGVRCVLDMHDILWRSYAEQWKRRRILPEAVRRMAIRRYRAREEEVWRGFDGITAISRGEYEYLERCGLPQSTKLFYAPMGVDLARWPYSWTPQHPPRLAFYGGFGNSGNRQAALRCLRSVMPEIWRRSPDTELWLVGSDPSRQLLALGTDSRVRITGFVEDVAPVLASMTAVLCPWSGTFGFRSRLIEVMALGVPVVATPDAVAGMGLQDGRDVLLGDRDEDLARLALRLLGDVGLARVQSRQARESVEQLFAMDNTYGRWMRELSEWLLERRRRAS